MSTSFATSIQLVPLEWECRNFGLSVARIDYPGGSERALVATLDEARRRRFDLVVLATSPAHELPQTLLNEFGGELVDRKATFGRSLEYRNSNSAAGSIAHDNSITEYAEAAASAELIRLAICAGAHSRFKIDSRFPQSKFRDMYRIWIERSVRHEIADCVLVDLGGTVPAVIRGFITLSQRAGVGKIGLIAVAEEHRGRGVGRRLLDAAHDWMRGHGASESLVVTQLHNAPACALYGSCGYELAQVECYYHFWPQIAVVRS